MLTVPGELAVTLPPHYIRPLARWQPRLGCWIVIDRYHRTLLQPVKAKTMEGVAEVAAAILQSYLDFPIVEGDDYLPTICESPGWARTCPHGVFLA